MKFFKSVDEKFEEIGFIKIKESEYEVAYKRVKSKKYIQMLTISHRLTGKHIVNSFDPNSPNCSEIGAVGEAITAYEMQLCLKKMKEMGWKIVKK